MNNSIYLKNTLSSPLLRKVLSDFCTTSRNFRISHKKDMRFVQFQVNGYGVQHLGAQIAPCGDIFDLSAIDSTLPNSLVEFLAGGNANIEKAKRLIAKGKSVVALKDAKLLSPITKPDKVACVALNYKGHCNETGQPYPKQPMIFSKFSSVIVGPYDTIKLPKISKQVDWEVELAVIIGKKGKNICPDEAIDHIFGYTVAQDITARDWKDRNNGQFLLMKTMDTFCPLGPVVVTKDKIDTCNLAVKSWVNGQLMQEGSTNELIFKPEFLVSYLSEIVTLYPGDVILTGTPAGVGVSKNPPVFLKKGDVLESEIEGIGRLKNTCE